jgi:DNA-binding CsgD family transcriptional regulator
VNDIAIARYLSISRRTLRRRITQLQEMPGANIRFQIATHAMKRGWI